jgi:predicted nuclease of predicted toxin-antitoxin system
MKLFFDHNLSYKLVGRLADLFPDAEHVQNINLHEADNRTVWEYARANDLAIAQKDNDFHRLSFFYGAPPKVVWVRLGNCTTTDIELALRRHHTDLSKFHADKEGVFLIVGIRRAREPSGSGWPRLPLTL